jgi:hypothetical protein
VVVSEKSYSRSKNEFTYQDGWIFIDQPSHLSLSMFLLGIDWGVDRLLKNNVGDLIIRVRDTDVGLFFIIPIAEVD